MSVFKEKELTPGEIDRRVDRFELVVSHRLDELTQKLDDDVIGRHEYAADQRAIENRLLTLSEDLADIETEQNQARDRLRAMAMLLLGSLALPIITGIVVGLVTYALIH